jgi:hypothetical protein
MAAPPAAVDSREAYPHFSYFYGDSRSWTAPIGTTSAKRPAIDPPLLAIDDDRNAIFAWTVVQTVLIGARPSAVPKGVQASFFDAAQQRWRAAETISSSDEQRASSVGFDGTGRAHVIMSGVARHFDPRQRTWSAAVSLEPAYFDPTLLRDARGDLHAVSSSCIDSLGCRLRVNRFDSAAGAWQVPMDLNAAGDDQLLFHVVQGPAGHGLVVWSAIEGEPSADNRSLWAAHVNGQSGAWSIARLASGQNGLRNDLLTTAIGANGHAAVAWRAEIDQPDGSSIATLQVTRWNPATSTWSTPISPQPRPGALDTSSVSVDALGNTTWSFARANDTTETTSTLFVRRWACRSNPTPDSGTDALSD